MLHLLPAEIALHIASYLPIQSLYQVSLVSTEWHGLIASNEQTVYHNAAILHRFNLDGDFEEGSSSRFPDRDWTQFCRKRLGIERGWRGEGPSTTKQLISTGKFVHRIKVDQNEGFVITTCHTGGLFVTDISTDCVLWAVIHVVDCAHCEYNHGYIIVNRHDNTKEVWRIARDFQDSDIPEDFKPDAAMVNASEDAARRYPSFTGRGHFRPWALLQMPDLTRAFRFSYPTLLSAGSSNAYLWDVPTSRLVETIGNIQVPNQDGPLGHINYVDVNDKYVFICGSFQLRIFAREGRTLVYHLTEKMLPPTRWDILPTSNNDASSSSLFYPQRLHEAPYAFESFSSNFTAAHVSSSNDLVALTASGIFIWIHNFERLIHHEASLNEAAVVLNLSLSLDNISIYLALGESNGKAAVATRTGMYIISLNPEINKLTAEAPRRPGLSVCRVMKYDNERHLSFITCLQMTNTGIFFNWYPSSIPNRFLRHVRHGISFPPLESPGSGPVLDAVNDLAVPAQGAQLHHEEVQGNHSPVFDPIEFSDNDHPEEDTSSNLPFPAHANQVDPPAVVYALDEEEGFLLADDEDFGIGDMDELEMPVDDVQFNLQFNDNGFLQAVNEWFLPVKPSVVHYIHV